MKPPLSCEFRGDPAYEAAKRDEIPTIRIGRRLLVPLAALERMLTGNTAA